jgi:hypothetical protein
MMYLFDKNGFDFSETIVKNSKPRKPTFRFSHRAVNHLHAIYLGLLGQALTRSDPDNCFKFPIQKKKAEALGRKCSQTRHFSLDEVKAIKNKVPGATINDIVSAIITVAMRRYFEKTDSNMLKDKNPKPLHLSFAANHRPHSTTAEDIIREGGSNRLVIGNFWVPLDCASPVNAIWRCKSNMEIYKTTPLISILWNATRFVLSYLPWSQLERLGSDAFFQPTGVISNVKGPTSQASIAGYLVTDISFYGVATGQGTYLGIISYKDRLRVCVCMDKHIEADPKEFRDCLETAYEDVRKAVLENASVDELMPLDMTPFSAKVLDVLFLAFLSKLFGWQVVAFAVAVYLCDTQQ